MESEEVLSSARLVFLNAFQDALQTLVPQAIEALFGKASASNSSAEQADIAQARALLQEQRGPLMQALSHTMAQLLAISVVNCYSSYRPRSSSNLAEDMSLLDSTAFESSLLSNNATNLFRNAAGQQLIDVNLRIAVLFKQDDICERENPFRPYLIARCITLVVQELHVTASLSRILMQQICDIIKNRLVDLYRELNTELAKSGLAAHLTLKINKTPEHIVYRAGMPALQATPLPPHVITAAAAQGGFPSLMLKPALSIVQWLAELRARTGLRCAAAAEVDETQSMPLTWLDGVDALGDVLRHAFGDDTTLSWESKARARPPRLNSDSVSKPGGQYLSSVRELIVQLQLAHAASPAAQGAKFSFSGLDFVAIAGQIHRFLIPDNSAMQNGRGELRNLVYERREALQHLARNAEQQMCIDIVIALFESILTDALLPLNLRLQLAKSQFLILQLALSDHSFLKTASHPARLLINRIASTALGLKHQDAARQLFEEELARVFKTLARHDCSIPGLFERIHNRFDTFVSRELRIQDKSVRRAVKLIEEAQIRYSQFEQASRSMQAALSGLTIAPQFQAFLEGEWIRAINLAARFDHDLAKRFRSFVADVVWSIDPKHSSTEQQALRDLTPQLFVDLQLGMDLLKWNRFKQNALSSWLTDAHSRAIKVSEQAARGSTLQEMHTTFKEFVEQPALVMSEVATADKFAEVLPYLVSLLEESGLVVELISDELAAKSAIASPQPVHAAANLQLLRERLISGIAFEMTSDKSSQAPLRRGCVQWCDLAMNTMVLSFQGQAEPVIISTEHFCRRAQDGSIRLAEQAPAFERAIHALLKTADLIDR